MYFLQHFRPPLHLPPSHLLLPYPPFSPLLPNPPLPPPPPRFHPPAPPLPLPQPYFISLWFHSSVHPKLHYRRATTPLF